MSDGGGKAGGWGGGEGAAAGTSHEIKLDERTDGRTDRCVRNSQSPSDSCGASLQDIRPDRGLMREHYKWGEGENTAAAVANY